VRIIRITHTAITSCSCPVCRVIRAIAKNTSTYNYNLADYKSGNEKTINFFSPLKMGFLTKKKGFLATLQQAIPKKKLDRFGLPPDYCR
jgi:hypothetical protein